MLQIPTFLNYLFSKQETCAINYTIFDRQIVPIPLIKSIQTKFQRIQHSLQARELRRINQDIRYPSSSQSHVPTCLSDSSIFMAGDDDTPTHQVMLLVTF